jgi:hypothetical protein
MRQLDNRTKGMKIMLKMQLGSSVGLTHRLRRHLVPALLIAGLVLTPAVTVTKYHAPELPNIV